MKTIEFQIISMENSQIHQNGFVEVSKDVEDGPEWFYYDQSGMHYPKEFTSHDGIGINQIGATDEQLVELDRFNELIHFQNVDFIDEIILTSDEDENRTYISKDGMIKVIINEGAKMECEFISAETNYGRYYATLVFRFNGARIELDDDLKQALVDEIDFIYGDCETTFINHYGEIVAEISKNHYGIFTDDNYYIKETEDVTEDILDSARMILAQQYTRNLGIYSKFGDMMEQSMDDCHDDTDLFWLSELDEEHLYEELSRAGYFYEEQQDSKYVCVKSDIDGKYRVMKGDDAPTGVCYSVADTFDDAVIKGGEFLGIDPKYIGEW